ncbi:hypothetical protein [Streptacidiphilus rugosus]|uniref:hypothetical protein n=1 Tax=Streptacidiphilus rugosus TaxID=405783 RepID=UPI00055AF545|nr:hypothetical protein [Streptacidiphilus rugosus]
MSDRQGRSESPAPRHRRPQHVSDEEVSALGKLSEALETTIRARGHLYSFHQLTGHADLLLDEAVTALRACGHAPLASLVEQEAIGRNVIEGRWTFQIVEEYDEAYYAPFVEVERAVRQQLAQGRPHLFEAEMKERRRTRSHPGHTARPS